VLVFFVSISVLVIGVSFFLTILCNGAFLLLVVAVNEVLNVLILLLELLFDLNINELRVVYADRSSFSLLANDLINDIHGLGGKFNKSECLFLFHIGMYSVNQMLYVGAVTIW
jgi:hypothetical protein